VISRKAEDTNTGPVPQTPMDPPTLNRYIAGNLRLIDGYAIVSMLDEIMVRLHNITNESEALDGYKALGYLHEYMDSRVRHYIDTYVKENKFWKTFRDVTVETHESLSQYFFTEYVDTKDVDMATVLRKISNTDYTDFIKVIRGYRDFVLDCISKLRASMAKIGQSVGPAPSQSVGGTAVSQPRKAPEGEIRVGDVVAPKRAVAVQSKVEARPEVKVEPRVEPRPEVKVEPRVEPRPEVKVEPRVEPRVESRVEPRVDTRKSTLEPVKKVVKPKELPPDDGPLPVDIDSVNIKGESSLQIE
jgi:hypothetical protein